MADKTGIEWTDATWNPVTGCTEVSPGCDHCYAKTFAERWRDTPGHYFEHGFDVQLRPDKLDLPLRWKKPRRIFVNSMSDLFHDQVPDEYIADVFRIMAAAPQHTFQVLTKRHARMRSLLNRWVQTGLPQSRLHSSLTVPVKVLIGASLPLPNVWLGVSAENQQWADIRIPALLNTPAAVRFVSAEPLLGLIDLRQSFAKWIPPIDHAAWATAEVVDRRPGTLISQMRVRDVLHWVIAGGESGRGARPMYPGWARSLRDQCQIAGVAYLFKQWGEWVPSHGHSRSQCLVWPDGAYREFTRTPGSFETGIPLTPSGWCNSERVGKKAAGRLLDGRTWDQYPQAVTRA